MQPGNPAFVNRINAYLIRRWQRKTPGPGLLAGIAIYQRLNQQATAEAYQDIYRLLSWMASAWWVRLFLSEDK